MHFQSNTILITIIAAAAILFVFFVFKKDVEPDDIDIEENVFAIPYLCNSIKTLLNGIINQNLMELCISRKEMEKRKKQKMRLSTAVRSCAQGNLGEREYIKDYIKDLLQSKLGISEDTVNDVIPFEQPELLTEQDKYEILLQSLKKVGDYNAFEKLSMECGFEAEKKNAFGMYYEVTREDINNAYRRLAMKLPYIIKLEVIAQRIFQNTYGFGCIDETLYQSSVDGISGGTSGITAEQYNFMEEIMKTTDITQSRSFDSVWIILHGKSIHLSFLSFENKSELVRVCKNLYLYDNVGHLTSTNGYKHSYLQNGSRVVVTRPKLTSGWAFFVRKFDSTKVLELNTLVVDDNSQIIIELTKWMVKGLLNIIISGDQGSGKTTYLKAILQYIDQRYQIRTTETEYELWINNVYPNLNVVAFRGTDEVSLIDTINIQKKTDGVIMILGEISDAAQTNAYITLTQAGTKCTIGTCHTLTAEDTIDYFRNGTLSSHGIFTSEMVAEEQVANSINIDIHWEKTADGHRYISYITEIIPLPRENIAAGNRMGEIAEALKVMARKRAFIARDIVVYENGRYLFKNPLSERCVKKIVKNLDKEDRERFLEFFVKGGA